MIHRTEPSLLSRLGRVAPAELSTHPHHTTASRPNDLLLPCSCVHTLHISNLDCRPVTAILQPRISPCPYYTRSSAYHSYRFCYGQLCLLIVTAPLAIAAQPSIASCFFLASPQPTDAVTDASTGGPPGERKKITKERKGKSTLLFLPNGYATPRHAATLPLVRSIKFRTLSCPDVSAPDYHPRRLVYCAPGRLGTGQKKPIGHLVWQTSV